MNYKFYTQPRATPQTQPIPGRETEMVRGRSGSYAFEAGLWQKVRRSLLVGTAQSTYYADKRELTEDFVDVVLQAADIDPERLAGEIVYASDGRSLNNSAPIFALVLLSMAESHAAKRAFSDIFLKVVRTASHFYEWLNYSKSVRGFGKVVRDAGRAWLSQDEKRLAYQLLKYPQRHGFSRRDVLRLFHLKPISRDRDLLFEWITRGWSELPPEPPCEALEQVWWYEWLKRHPERTHEAIANGRLTHEMAAPVGKMDTQAWQLLFEDMPIGAMLRNLGSLTQLGVLQAQHRRNLRRVESVLTNRQHLRRGRIHPIDILKALKTYRSGGQIGRSRKTWTPIPRICDILETALERSFDVLQPTGKVFLHAVDISGSMSWSTINSVGLTCCEIATTMALATAKAEKNYAIRGFSTAFKDLGICQRDSFTSALAKTSAQNFGGTDASVAYDWAIRNRFRADVICFWTDSESWAGPRHPVQALAEYRAKVNPNAKAVYVTLAPYNLSLVDPRDPHSWDMGGFDPSMPRLIQMVATGEL